MRSHRSNGNLPFDGLAIILPNDLQYADYLRAEEDDGLRTVFGQVVEPIACRVLRLHAEEKSGRKVLNSRHAGPPVRIVHVDGVVVQVHDGKPRHGKH